MTRAATCHLLLLTLALGACAMLPERIAEMTAVPQPFRGRDKALLDLPALHLKNEIHLWAVDGLSAPDRSALAASLAKAGDAVDLMILSAPPERPVRLLEGRVEVDPDELRGTWTLRGTGGDVEARFSTTTPRSREGSLDGARLAPADHKALAQDILGSLRRSLAAIDENPWAASAVSETQDPPADQRLVYPPSLGRPEIRPNQKAVAGTAPAPVVTSAAPLAGIAVQGIAGAGLGEVRLKAALEQALIAAGATGATGAAGATGGETALSLTGTAERVPAGEDAEEIRFIWRLHDPEGREIGVVTQSNLIPAGSFDEVVDLMAEEVAAGAVAGLMDLVAERYATRPRP